jgi:hypothetical protein
LTIGGLAVIDALPSAVDLPAAVAKSAALHRETIEHAWRTRASTPPQPGVELIFWLTLQPARGALSLVHDFVAAFPELEPLHAEHLNDYNEVLDHLWLADLMRYIASLLAAEDGPNGACRAEAILDYMEARFATATTMRRR